MRKAQEEKVTSLSRKTTEGGGKEQMGHITR